ncbi:MAG: membrane integrity-associated transporter subunit PqiC [Acidobacteria bacterium]|nr:membrane integrity-associated transporter subunit PqiC [Acidobacteriota bacterium]MCG3195334.1 hypothetical protein [Thermoanaerobaculia bacterium]
MRNAFSNRLTRPGLAALCGLLFLVPIAGCLSKPPLVTESFALEGPIESKPPAPDGPVLVIRRVALAPIYQTPDFVYRTGDHQFERDGYARFLVSPEQMLETAIVDYMSSSGAFRRVVTTGRGAADEIELRLLVSELSGDFRDPANPRAVLEIECRAARVLATALPESLQKTYRRSIPLPARTAAALASGWNTALAEIMGQAAADLKAFGALRTGL